MIEYMYFYVFGEMYTFFYAELADFLLLSVSMYSVILQIVFRNVCKMLHATTLCSSALTVIHCGLPQGHWG